MFLPSAAAGVVATASVTPSESNVTPGSDTSWSSPGGQNELGFAPLWRTGLVARSGYLGEGLLVGGLELVGGQVAQGAVQHGVAEPRVGETSSPSRLLLVDPAELNCPLVQGGFDRGQR